MSHYPADKIFASAEAVRKIADEGNTPFYLYNSQGIQQSIKELHDAFLWMPGYQNYFPLRENINPHILRILCKGGTGVSVTNNTELEHARNCGFHGENILYEPSARNAAAEKLAFELNATWLFHSVEMIPETLPERVILCFNPCDLPFPPPVKKNILRMKNGLNSRQIMETVDSLHTRGAVHIGLALQVSSYSIQPNFWCRKATILFDLLKTIYQRIGVKIWCCHIGEGPGLPFHPKVSAPELAVEVASLREAFESLPEELRPTLITGLSSRLVDPHGILVTKVLEERFIYKTFLVLDAGICQYSRSALKQAYRHVSVLGRNEIENRKLYSLVGSLPNTIDRAVSKGRMLPKVKPGEYCVIHDVGCGGRSMPMLYGLQPVAAEFLYEPDGTIHQIARRRTENEVLDFLTAW